VAPLDEFFVITEFKEHSESSRAEEKDIACVFQKARHLSDAPLLLLIGQILIFFCTILVAEGKSRKLTDKQHRKRSNVEIESAEVYPHAVDMLRTKVG
jgi:hypothetical protein